MDKKEFTSCMDYLYTAYPNKPSLAEVKLYYDLLGDYPTHLVIGAIRKWIAKEKFFPRVSQLIELIQGTVITYEQVMNELSLIVKSSTWNRSMVHPVTYKIQKELGGKMTMGSLSLENLEKKVKRIYKYHVKDEICGIEGVKKEKPGIRSGAMLELGNIIKNKGG